jgi:hypothetical protein
MSFTRLQIWNLALAKAGISRQLVDDKVLDSPLAQTLHNLYEPTLFSFLEEHSWSFAKRTVPLVLSDYEHIKWEYCYEYPDDCLCIRMITSKASIDTKDEIPVLYEIITDENTGRLLIGTNEADAYAIYTTNNIREEAFPSMFVQAFATRLAAEIAMAHAGDRGKHLDLLQLSMQMSEGSKESNANEAIHVVCDYESKYRRARY